MNSVKNLAASIKLYLCEKFNSIGVSCLAQCRLRIQQSNVTCPRSLRLRSMNVSIDMTSTTTTSRQVTSHITHCYSTTTQVAATRLSRSVCLTDRTLNYYITWPSDKRRAVGLNHVRVMTRTDSIDADGASLILYNLWRTASRFSAYDRMWGILRFLFCLWS